MESALQLCKEEIRTYVGALEETKNLYEREIDIREEKVGAKGAQVRPNIIMQVFQIT